MVVRAACSCSSGGRMDMKVLQERRATWDGEPCKEDGMNASWSSGPWREGRCLAPDRGRKDQDADLGEEGQGDAGMDLGG